MIVERVALNVLRQLALSKKLTSEKLNNLVHTVAVLVASRTNEFGLESQLEFLLENLGYDGAVKELERIGAK
jgi:hypothetical protein